VYYSGIGRLMRPCSLALFRMDWRRSAASTKSKGERGSPCLTLLQWNTFLGEPFNKTKDVPELKISFIHDSPLSPKPFLLMISSIAPCSILSKAFSKSSLRIISSFLDVWHRCRYSKDQAKQSWMVLVLINPYWLRWTNFVMRGYSLLARSFVMTLIEELSSETGLNSFILVGPSTFGTRVI
jgi:hypothetical protein